MIFYEKNSSAQWLHYSDTCALTDHKHEVKIFHELTINTVYEDDRTFSSLAFLQVKKEALK